MLMRNQKSKMVYDVKELKEYFDKRFNELKNSLDVNNNTLENFKSEINFRFAKIRRQEMIKSKYSNQTRNSVNSK